jgi:hypothetical protein
MRPRLVNSSHAPRSGRLLSRWPNAVLVPLCAHRLAPHVLIAIMETSHFTHNLRSSLLTPLCASGLSLLMLTAYVGFPSNLGSRSVGVVQLEGRSALSSSNKRCQKLHCCASYGKFSSVLNQISGLIPIGCSMSNSDVFSVPRDSTAMHGALARTPLAHAGALQTVIHSRL